MRGEFIRADGLVIPNNISKEGAKAILAMTFRNEDFGFYMALVKGAPTADMTIGLMQEPTIGVNGYARQALARNSTDWPTQGFLADEAYVESKLVTFVATGSGFDKAINRLALVTTNVYNSSTPVLNLSSPLSEDLTILTSTPLSQRQFKYRIYI